MENSKDITGGLSPLEQRRERLRAFADRVLEAVEALPMPKNAADSERTLRAIATADRMLIQLYKKIPWQQTVTPAPNSPKTEEEAPFVYIYDDGIEGTGDTATPDLEQRANEIFAQYLAAIAEKSDTGAFPSPDGRGEE